VTIAAELVADITRLNTKIRSYEQQIAALDVVAESPLLAIAGCGALTAAKILGETGDITRFTDEAAFATNAGVAPIPVSSGNTDRVRLNRGGNRQLNRALHHRALPDPHPRPRPRPLPIRPRPTQDPPRSHAHPQTPPSPTHLPDPHQISPSRHPRPSRLT
jgi:transposase